jgi:hypothetical protein
MQYNADKGWFKSRSMQISCEYVLSYTLEMKHKLIRLFLD